MESNNSPVSTTNSIFTISDADNLILSFLNVFDLLNFAQTCKRVRQYVEHKGWLKSLQRLVFKYDLEYLPDDISWLKLIERYDKIDRSIRNGYAVVNCLVTPTKPENNIQDRINAITSNDEYFAINWTVTEGIGSGAFDTVTNSAVLDFNQRNPIKTTVGNSALRLIGDRMGVQDFNDRGPDRFHYENPIEIQDIKDEEGNILYSLTARQRTVSIRANQDPRMKHLIAIIAPIIKSDSLLDRADLEIVIFDTKALAEVKKIVLVDASEPQLYYGSVNVVFKGNTIYYSENIHPVSESTLHIVDWTKDNDHKKITLPGTWSDIYGVHKSLVYGVSSVDWNNRSIYVYDLNTGKYLQHKKKEHYYRSNLAMLGGYLVHIEDSMLHFIDYKGEKLDVVSSFIVSNCFSDFFKVRHDGTILLNGNDGMLKQMDFENTCDMIEVMQMTGVNGETVIHSFAAHELAEKMEKLLGMDFVSRYHRLKKDYRCGIIYRGQQTGPKLPLSQKYFRHKAQYNSPYDYFQGSPGTHTFEWLYHVPNYTESGLYGTVVFFYEKWDGHRFKLAKPQDWQKVLLK